MSTFLADLYLTLKSKFRLVLENSGVAEPQKLRDKFNEAIEDGHPIMDRIRLNTMVLASSIVNA